MSKQTRPVIITGGTGALGGAVVGAMLARGYACHVTYHIEAELERFPHRERVELHHVDCTDEGQVQALYDGLPAIAASIHLVGGFAMSDIDKTALAELERMFRLNVSSAFLCCREAVKGMRAAGGGRIVNVAARPAEQPTPGMIAYAVAKGAVAALTRSLSAEVLADGILVNAVLPSIIDTPQNRKAMPDADFGQFPTPGQVANTIAFLAGEENELTSGALLPVYGKR